MSPVFANPWMLVGLVAAGLPVVIHFLTRARPRRIALPTYKFLEEACAGQQALHRLRTIILLTLRCLAVLALVLLFARPFLKPDGTARESEAGKRVVILVDASLSMRAVQNGVTLFSRAQSEAAEVLRALASGSEASVILYGAAPRPLLPALSRNLPALHDKLVKAVPTYEAGDPAAALALAKRLLHGPGTVYVFSNFQKSDWGNVGELPGGVICRLRSVISGPVDNVGITSAVVTPVEPVIGEAAEVVCTVFNSTPLPRQEQLRLELGDFTHETRVSVPPFGSADAVFSVNFPTVGTFVGKASLTPDNLSEDNTRHLAINVHRALQILLVSDTDASDTRSAAFFLRYALAPSPQASPGLTVIRRHSQDTDRGILESADVFVLAPPAQLSGEAMEIIQRRVREGAGLVAFLDGPTAPALMPTEFAPPFRLALAVASEGGDNLVPGTRKLFVDSESADWSPFRFRRHYLTQTLSGRENEVFLTYPDHSAALTQTTVGKGAAIFANFPLTLDASDFVGSPLFPAMVHELLRSIRHGANERATVPGSAWMMEAPTKGESPVSVTGPDGQPVAAPVVASGRTTRVSMPIADLPGAYLMKQGDALVGAGVVNVDPRESDTRTVSLTSIKGASGAEIKILNEEEDFSSASENKPLWPQVAGAAAVFLALEMLLLACWRPATVKPVSRTISTPAVEGGS